MQLDYEQVPPGFTPFSRFVAPLCRRCLIRSLVFAKSVHDGERGAARASQPAGDRASPVRAATHHASRLQVSVRIRKSKGQKKTRVL